MNQYIAVKLGEHRIDIKCPEQCRHDVPESHIQRLVSQEQFDTFTRLKAEHANKNIRSCPSCQTLVVGNPAKPDMQCTSESCRQDFCFFHGLTLSLHDGMVIE